MVLKRTQYMKKSIIILTQQTKKLSQEGIKILKKTPKMKIAQGTAIILIPGALTVYGAYEIGKKLVVSYKEYKKNPQDKKFLDWFAQEANNGVKNQIKDLRQKSISCVEVVKKPFKMKK